MKPSFSENKKSQSKTRESEKQLKRKMSKKVVKAQDPTNLAKEASAAISDEQLNHMSTIEMRKLIKTQQQLLADQDLKIKAAAALKSKPKAASASKKRP